MHAHRNSRRGKGGAAKRSSIVCLMPPSSPPFCLRVESTGKLYELENHYRLDLVRKLHAQAFVPISVWFRSSAVFPGIRSAFAEIWSSGERRDKASCHLTRRYVWDIKVLGFAEFAWYVFCSKISAAYISGSKSTVTPYECVMVGSEVLCGGAHGCCAGCFASRA